jgi:hemerythrin
MAEEVVAWSDDFSVGNETIDAQHKELIRLTNEFYSGVQMGGMLAKVYFLQTIKGAVQYVKTHFADEEALMLKAGYPHPQYEEHKKQHEDFVAEVTQQVKNFEQEDNPDPEGFVKYLMNWILQHVADSDKKYSPYVSKLN